VKRNAPAALLATLAAACGSVDRPADWSQRLPPPPGAFAAPGPFDPMAIDGIWGVGDQVVYAIEVDEPGAHHGFTFTLTTTRLPPSRPDPLADAHPVHGHVLTRSSHDFWQLRPVAYLGTGPGRLRADLRGDDGAACGGEIEAELFAHFFVDDMAIGMTTGVHPLFAALLGLDCMHTTLMRVIRAPAALSVLAHFGRVELALEWQEVERLEYADQETPFGVLPTTWLPFTIRANGQPALDGRVQFTWKRPPLLLAAGVLQVEAWHPDDASRRLRVRLASAVRGTPPDAPAADDLGVCLTAGMTAGEVLAAEGGTKTELRERGRLADGRLVELVWFEVPRQALFGVLHDGRLLFASLGDHMARDWLRRRGFVADAPTADDERR
jgi:hypothetical protein